MKNSRMIATAVAVALTLGTFQVEAKKSAARKRFDASYDRVKKCFKGDCTRMEGLKAARDLSAAALVAVTAAVVGAKVAGKGAVGGIAVAERRGYLPDLSRRNIAAAKVYTGAIAAQRPYDVTFGRGAAATAEAAKGLREKLPARPAWARRSGN